jgi:small subunit ribosomal protein S6
MLAMRAYELMVIIDGDAEEGVAESFRDKITEAVAAAGGEVKSTDMWGRRRFAYEINHKWEGTYFVMELLGPGGNALDEMERSLRLADDVVRHKLLRLPDNEAARRGLLGASA